MLKWVLQPSNERQGALSWKAQDNLITEEVLEKHLSPIKSDILVMKWMLAAIFGLMMLIGNKILFPT